MTLTENRRGAFHWLRYGVKQKKRSTIERSVFPHIENFVDLNTEPEAGPDTYKVASDIKSGSHFPWGA